jgi:hypothetical protein
MSRILAMTDNDVIAAFDRMRVWQQGERRAVHKPLLVIFALARVNAGETARSVLHIAPHAVCAGKLPSRVVDLPVVLP